MGFEQIPSAGAAKPTEGGQGMSRRDFLKKFVPKRDSEPRETESADVGYRVMRDAEEPDEESKPDGMTRRDFLRLAGAAVAGCATGGIGMKTILNLPGLRNTAEDALIGERLKKEIEEKKRFINERYGIDVHYNDLPKWMKGEAPTPTPETPGRPASEIPVVQQQRETYQTAYISTLSETKRNIDVLVQELAFFPPDYVRRSPLTRIDLVGMMIREIKTKKGGTITFSLAGHVEEDPDSQNGKKVSKDLLLTVMGNSSNHYNYSGWTEGDIRATFPHEMLHVLDDMSEEEWYDSVHRSDADDDGFRYGVTQGQKDEFTVVPITNLESRGFSRNYGRIDRREDRATVFEVLAKGSSKQLHDKMDDDPILVRKLSVVAGYLLRQSHGLMDGQYWGIVRSGSTLPQGYFEREAERISQTPYEAYVADERHFNTGGLRIGGIPTREEYESWQRELADKKLSTES
ncbi:MAG: twin-arginine translocation signal domain-containing protein [Candidatus Moranbacteria bacterium]|nr:twin-arginine translocation signal domain-containing protein [Candidatus Moranbacteria bacterium]